MDVDTLVVNKEHWKKLTDNDIIRLKKIDDDEFSEIINFMLEHNCKLEQEAVE